MAIRMKHTRAINPPFPDQVMQELASPLEPQDSPSYFGSLTLRETRHAMKPQSKIVSEVGVFLISEIGEGVRVRDGLSSLLALEVLGARRWLGFRSHRGGLTLLDVATGEQDAHDDQNDVEEDV